MWVYIHGEVNLWTVGFFDPAGHWYTDSVHGHREDARRTVAWLNGSGDAIPPVPETYGEMAKRKKGE